MNYKPGLFHSQQALYKVKIRITHSTIDAHVAFALGRFFGENVTFESFLKCNFTRTGNFKALLCAAVRFYLWHCITFFSYSLLAFRNTRKLMEPCGK